MLYACDEKWWKHHIQSIKKTFSGRLFTQYHNQQTKKFADSHGIESVEGRSGDGLGRNNIKHGSNSGCQAINLAWLLATKEWGFHPRIILLGFDMGSTGGKNHWFGDHPKGFTNGTYKSFVPRFNQLAEDLKGEGVEVINCSRSTNLTQFKRATIDDYPDFHSVE